MQMTIDGFMAPTLPEQTDTLAQARADLRSRLDDGSTCPCCGQYSRRYKRKLTKPMVAWLAWLVKSWRRRSHGWVDVRESTVRGGDYGKLVYWGLIEQRPHDDGSKRTSGMWRPTDRGIAFMDGALSVPSHVYVYGGTAEGFTESSVTVDDVVGAFNYAEMMGGA